ncbi:MAG: alpha/beta hydrolase [Desulfatiglandaceae bacterium]
MGINIMGGIALCLGVLVVMGALYLLFVSIVPGFPASSRPLKPQKRSGHTPGENPLPVREDRSFQVEGTRVSAWLYLPHDPEGRFPCIIMGHGAGGTKDMMLENYAVRFQKAGLAVLSFDYRHFGASGGRPRNLIWIPHQLADWAGAIAYARGLKRIDPEKIALWGTSFGGGHVMVTASKDTRITCAAAQCPALDGRASGEAFSKREGIGYTLRMMVHGQRDMVRSWLRLSPHKIPLVGRKGDIALMPDDAALQLFESVAPDDFANEICARIILRWGRYKPVKYAKKVGCPVLLQICEKDIFTPLSAARKAEHDLGSYGEVKYYPIGHFDIYTGVSFETAVSDQLAFFKKHLL